MEDLEIIKEVKNGKKELFGKIVEKYMRKAYAVALYYTHDNHLSWDISQEAFYRVFKGIKNFEENQEFFPYLYKIIINVIRKMKQFEYEDIDSIVVPYYDDPQKLIEKKEMIEKLKKAIDKLDKKDKEIIYLRHFAELDYSEIAKVLNIPIGNVCSRLYYARKRLLKWMKE